MSEQSLWSFLPLMLKALLTTCSGGRDQFTPYLFCKVASFMVVGVMAIALSGCGGGSSAAMPTTTIMQPPTKMSEALTLPPNHGLAAGQYTMQPGASDEHGNVVLSCPAGDNACVVDVLADGTATYDQTGGAPTVMVAYAPWNLPLNHGLAAGQYTVEPGTSDEHGNVVLSCPSGGSACVIDVLADNTATYDRTGGAPIVMVERLPFPITDIMGGAPATLSLAFAGYRDSLGKTIIPPSTGRRASLDDVLHSPITFSARLTEQGHEEPLIHVGIDQGTNEDWGFTDGVQQTREGVGNLPIVISLPDLDIRYGRIEDGAGTQTLHAFFTEYLASAASEFLADSNLHNKALRYRTPPVIRLIGSPTALEVQETIAALQLINAGLPESAKLLMGDTLPGLSFPDDAAGRSNWPLENVIAIDFQDAQDAFEEDGSRTHGTSYADNEFRADGSIKWSYIRVGRIVAGRCPGCDIRQELTGTVAHELVHALGIYGHVDPFAYRSLMNSFGSKGILWPTDREALRVLYDRLQPGDSLPLNFGPWASDSLHIHGNGPFAGFGVALRNGYAEPWAYGDLPDGDLADNSALSGSVTWTGTLLGLTPDAAAVRGDAKIGIDLELMAGRADFTRLETWGAAPGAVGTGTTWGVGALGYTIVVRGNTFRETGGDAGRLTGSFTGLSHEGVAGTLERTDLTAAFGGAR